MLSLKLKDKQLDGAVSLVELNLGTLKPVIITGVKFLMSARIVICDTKATAQKLQSSYYQMMDTAPAGVLFECSSNVIWSAFDFTKPPVKPDQLMWFRYPEIWQPATIQSRTGKLWCFIEARCGNPKHKATISIDLYTGDYGKEKEKT